MKLKIISKTVKNMINNDNYHYANHDLIYLIWILVQSNLSYQNINMILKYFLNKYYYNEMWVLLIQ